MPPVKGMTGSLRALRKIEAAYNELVFAHIVNDDVAHPMHDVILRTKAKLNRIMNTLRWIEHQHRLGATCRKRLVHRLRMQRVRAAQREEDVD